MNQHAVELVFAKLGYRAAIRGPGYLRYTTTDHCPTGVSVHVKAVLEHGRWAVAGFVVNGAGDVEIMHEGEMHPGDEHELELIVSQLGAHSHEHRLARMAERMAT